MSANGGLGSVIEKDITIATDTMAAGKLTACKHGNGRDWWVFAPRDEEFGNKVYKLLLTPNGIQNLGIFEMETPQIAVGSVGNAIFTPDGSRYIKHDIRFDPWNAIGIYDFNRCTGELELVEHFEINDTSFLYGGSAVSPDGHYLYAVTNYFIYQFDLTAPGIEASKTLVSSYDGFVGLLFHTLFGTPQLAPDGSIWIATVSDTVMHVIRTPNQLGLACHVDQHAIHLPKINQKSIPNFPNFRLGPLDGSPCDTLGLDNHPLAGFTWYAEQLEVYFSDNSTYRPETWAWDFGDGSPGSTERNPVHGFPSSGVYEVCLTAANEYDSSTVCHWVSVSELKAAFGATPEVGLSIAFADLSEGTPTNWHWDFGDGGSSQLQHPLHAYPEKGSYQVCLTVSDQYLSRSVCRHIAVSELRPDFMAQQGPGLSIAFTDLSEGPIFTWHWDFGDGGIAGVPDPVHVFPAVGAYEVCLTIFDMDLSATHCAEVTVTDSVSAAGETHSEPRLLVVPNPARTGFSILWNASISMEAKWEVSNLLGEVLHSGAFLPNGGSPRKWVDVSTWPPGLYLLRLEAAGQVWLQKVVVQR